MVYPASRKGFADIARALCSESECTPYDPSTTRNKKGELPIDIARTHACFQEIKSACDRLGLLRDLYSLRG
jgi:hypothetical protein